jgi:hypothetical protein
MSCFNNETTHKLNAPSNRVRFDRVEIRTYAVILGDNPGGRNGAPLSLSWEYDVLGHLPVERFEEERVDERRNLGDLWLDSEMRQYILRRVGYTDDQISQAEKDAQLIRHRRRSSYFKSVIQHPAFNPKSRVKSQQVQEQQRSDDCSHLSCLKVLA